MGLLEEIKAVPTGGGVRLRVDVVLDDLDGKDAAEFRAALEDPSIKPSQIVKALSKRGHVFGDGSVRKWRVVNGVS